MAGGTVLQGVASTVHSGMSWEMPSTLQVESSFCVHQVKKSEYNSRVFKLLKKSVESVLHIQNTILHKSLIIKSDKIRVPTFPQSRLEKPPWQHGDPQGQFAQHRTSRPDLQPGVLSSSRTPHLHLI